MSEIEPIPASLSDFAKQVNANRDDFRRAYASMFSYSWLGPMPMAEVKHDDNAYLRAKYEYAVKKPEPDRSSFEAYIRSTMPPERAEKMLVENAAEIEAAMDRAERDNFKPRGNERI